VIVWANGACSLDGTAFGGFLTQIASHGLFIIANGSPGGAQGSGSGSNTSPYLQSAMDWVSKNAGSGKYTQVDASRMAVAGQSCGGLDAYIVQGDSRLSAVGIFNSGELDQSSSQRVAPYITKPIFYFLGGSSDIAYTNVSRLEFSRRFLTFL
jgi:dienelactone hydrolase